MATTRIKFVVEMAYTGKEECPPYIKKWWATQQLEKAVEESLAYQNDNISDVDITCESVMLLSELIEPIVEKLVHD